MAYFANNPIIATVTIGSNTFPSSQSNKSSNRRFILKVTINGREYQFTHAAENGMSYNIDVSSAYRAELARLATPTPSAPTSQTVTGTVSVTGEYINNGVITSVSPTVSGGNVTARRGGYSEVERINFTNNVEAPSVLSTKPSVEVVKTGSYVQLGSTKITAQEGLNNSAANGHKYYGETNNHRHTMYFINRYGEVESVSIVTLESLDVTNNSTTIEQVRSPRYASYAKKRNYHTGGNNVWKMSSGYLEREWLQWFAHDFMMSEYYWLDTKQGIIPVLVTSDDSIGIYDKATGDIKAVNFKVESAIEGEIFL